MRKKTPIIEVIETLRNVSIWKESGLKIVFTNGCFDLLHPGHIAYLEEAKALGDKLIVAINSDSSVERLKGAGRPIYILSDRVQMLSSLTFVDLVVTFETDTPLALIEKIQPHVLVKGGDYKTENIVGAKFVIKSGGMVKTLTFEKGYSTTEIIKKIKNS